MWNTIFLLLVISIIILIVYVSIKTYTVLKITSEIDVLLSNTKKSLEDIEQREKGKARLEPFYLEKMLIDIKQLRVNFATNKIFNQKEPRPTVAQYKMRYELLQKMETLEQKMQFHLYKHRKLGKN